jgi:hypothetical protein
VGYGKGNLEWPDGDCIEQFNICGKGGRENLEGNKGHGDRTLSKKLVQNRG